MKTAGDNNKTKTGPKFIIEPLTTGLHPSLIPYHTTNLLAVITFKPSEVLDSLNYLYVMSCSGIARKSDVVRHKLQSVRQHVLVMMPTCTVAMFGSISSVTTAHSAYMYKDLLQNQREEKLNLPNIAQQKELMFIILQQF